MSTEQSDPAGPGTRSTEQSDPADTGTRSTEQSDPADPGTRSTEQSDPADTGTRSTEQSDPADPGTSSTEQSDPADPGTRSTEQSDPAGPGTRSTEQSDPADPGTRSTEQSDPADPGTRSTEQSDPADPGTRSTEQSDAADTQGPGLQSRVIQQIQGPGLQSRVIQQTHRMDQKTALIVYAHQSPGSFNAAARDVTMQELAAQGYRVLVSDLYAMNFRANSTRDDIIGDLKNPELFQYGEETMHAWLEGRLSEDIVAEQHKVKEAELIIFQFPLYWFSVPAIMKGWMDRVLAQGFAFSMEKMYNNGVFKDKKAMLSFTTGATQTMFQPDGINGDINIALWPLQNGTLHFCGFQVLAPQIFWSPAHSPPAVRTMMLDVWRTRVKGLLAEKPLTFAPCELFDLSFQGGFLLCPKVRKEQESQPYGITTGHHLGKPLPPDNQVKAQPGVEGSAGPNGTNEQIPNM